MEVAGYVRVSTEQQMDQESHLNQRAKLERWATMNDHDLELFEDIAISGQADEREAYDELMGRAGEFDAVVVRELSRFGRSLRQVLNDIKRLDEEGVEFIALEDDVDTSTAQGKLLMHIIGAFNEFWANLARERAEEMIQKRREEGKPVGRPKKVDDDELADVLEWHEKGLSYGEIRTLLREVHGTDVSRRTIYRYCNESDAKTSGAA